MSPPEKQKVLGMPVSCQPFWCPWPTEMPRCAAAIRRRGSNRDEFLIRDGFNDQLEHRSINFG
jgi:hypothetical protein